MTGTRVSRVWRPVVLAGAAVLACGALAPAARARLVFVRAIHTEHPTIWVARDDGRGAHRLVAGAGPSISPDGRLVAYDVPGAHYVPRLMIVPAAGGRPRLLVDGGSGAVWSPDGRRIATTLLTAPTRTRPQTAEIVTVDVASGAVHAIAPPGLPEGVSFSPDGRWLAWTVITQPAGSGLPHDDLYRAPADGGRPVRITRTGDSMWLVWGPRWIAFVRERRCSPHACIPKDDVYLVKPSGAGMHHLTRAPTGDRMFGFVPTGWSANGHRLLAAFHGLGVGYAVAIDARTGVVHRIGQASHATRGRSVDGVAISRDGTTILGVQSNPAGTEADVVALSWHGGRPRLLARNAQTPSWSR